MEGYHTFDENDSGYDHGSDADLVNADGLDGGGFDDDVLDDGGLDDGYFNRRSSSDPDWSVVVGSPRPQPKERPAVAGPCLICVFLLLRFHFHFLLPFHFHFSSDSGLTFFYHLTFTFPLTQV